MKLIETTPISNRTFSMELNEIELRVIASVLGARPAEEMHDEIELDYNMGNNKHAKDINVATISHIADVIYNKACAFLE